MESRVHHVAGPSLKLAPFGDLQFGAEGCDVEKARRHIQFGIEHDWRFVGMGDYIDFASPSSRFKIETAGAYEIVTNTLEDAAQAYIKRAYEEVFQGSEGRWFGIVEGHHFWPLRNGPHPHTDYVLADQLKTEFLGTTGHLSIFIGDCPRPLVVHFTHGDRSSVTTTGTIAHLERLMRDWDFDILLVGHNCKKYGIPYDYMRTTVFKDTQPDGSWKWKSHVVADTRIIAQTGGFMRGYIEGSHDGPFIRGSYVERRMLPPIPTGGMLIEIRPVQEDWGWRMDMFVSA